MILTALEHDLSILIIESYLKGNVTDEQMCKFMRLMGFTDEDEWLGDILDELGDKYPDISVQATYFLEAMAFHKTNMLRGA